MWREATEDVHMNLPCWGDALICTKLFSELFYFYRSCELQDPQIVICNAVTDPVNQNSSQKCHQFNFPGKDTAHRIVPAAPSLRTPIPPVCFCSIAEDTTEEEKIRAFTGDLFVASNFLAHLLFLLSRLFYLKCWMMLAAVKICFKASSFHLLSVGGDYFLNYYVVFFMDY